DEFKPCAIGRELPLLRRFTVTEIGFMRLPGIICELVVVPCMHERKARPRRLKVGVGQIGLVEVAIIRERDGGLTTFLPVRLCAIGYPRIAAIGQGADEARRGYAFRHIAGAFIDEIAEMQNEVDLVFARGADVVIHEAAERAVVTLLIVLAGDDSKPHLACGAGARRGSRAAGKERGVAARIEAVVIDRVRRQPLHENAHRMVRLACGPHRLLHDNASELFIRCDLKIEIDIAIGERRALVDCLYARPEHHRIRLRITRGEALRKMERAGSGLRCAEAREERGCSSRERETSRSRPEQLQKLTTVERHSRHGYPLPNSRHQPQESYRDFAAEAEPGEFSEPFSSERPLPEWLVLYRNRTALRGDA